MSSFIDPFTARCYFVNMLHNLVDPEFCKHSIGEMQVPLSETDRRLWDKVVAILAERDEQAARIAELEAVLQTRTLEYKEQFQWRARALEDLGDYKAQRDSLRARVKELEDDLLLFNEVKASRDRLQSAANEMAEALEKQHQWHIWQTERAPVFFGDTIGYVPADEYAESEMGEKTAEALAKFRSL